MVFGQEMLLVEPSMRNSNLLPVKANGEVRFLSVVSRMNSGITSTPSFIAVALMCS